MFLKWNQNFGRTKIINKAFKIFNMLNTNINKERNQSKRQTKSCCVCAVAARSHSALALTHTVTRFRANSVSAAVMLISDGAEDKQE